MEARHNHYMDNSYYPDCPRCKINEAAPELLEACKELLDYMEKEHDSFGDMIYFSKEVCAKARDAIAKCEE